MHALLAALFLFSSSALAFDPGTFVPQLKSQAQTPEQDLLVTVTDASGAPLEGASVMVGEGAGLPFAGNTALTDASGTASFSHEALRGALFTVTASRAGTTTVSLFGQHAGSVQIALAGNERERGSSFLRGKLTGFPPGKGMDSLEVGFFLPAARPESLLAFDVNSIVSPYKVEVDIFGPREIPGNVVLPTQSKMYGFIPISVSKPEFIMPLERGTKAHMGGLIGHVSINKAASLLQKKDFLGVLNLASLTHVGWTRQRMEVRGDETFDLNAGLAVTPAQLTARLSNSPAGLDAVAVSLYDPAGDRGDFVAMDIKALKKEGFQNGGGSIRLGMAKDRLAPENFHVFTALFDNAQMVNQNGPRAIVGAVRPVRGQSSVAFNAFLKPIQALGVGQGQREYRFTKATNGSLAPGLVILNIVAEQKDEETKGKVRKVLWSAVTSGDASALTLPDLGRAVLPAPEAGETFRWEVIAVRASGASLQNIDLQGSLRDLQDVSTLLQPY